MIVDFQFSKVLKIAWRDKEKGSGADGAVSDDRKRFIDLGAACPKTLRLALRSRGCHGEFCGQRVRSVVTSGHSGSARRFKGRISARRMTLFPPTPNQALQPTRMLVTVRAYARLAPSTRVADL